MVHILKYIKVKNSLLSKTIKQKEMKKWLWIFIGLVVVFLIISYNRGKEITEKSNNATESINKNSVSITETQAIAIGCQFVEINVPGASDFSQKKADPITEVENAFYVQGHFMVNDVEYKFGVPIHYTGGEWSAHRNWEWARMEIVQVGTVDLKELHGTWNYSMF